MENFNDFIGSISASILKQGLKADTKIALIVSTFGFGGEALLTSRAGFRRHWKCCSQRVQSQYIYQSLFYDFCAKLHYEFQNHEKYKHNVLAPVSEFLSMSQIEDSHQRATGKPLPSVPIAFGWLLIKLNNATQGL